jgi:hypothetical protein
MRVYNKQTKRRIVRVLRNAIAAIQNDAIRTPSDVGVVANLLETIVIEAEANDPQEIRSQFFDSYVQPDADGEAFLTLIRGWEKLESRPYQLGAVDSPVDASEVKAEPAESI